MPDDTLRERLAEGIKELLPVDPDDGTVVSEFGDFGPIWDSADEVSRGYADALLPRIREHVAEVWEAYEGWRDKGQDAFRALLTIWQALEPDRKNMTFGDDPQRVVDETLRALKDATAVERVRRLHMSSEVDDIVTPDEDRAGKPYHCLGCNEVAPCSTIRALDAEGSDDS